MMFLCGENLRQEGCLAGNLSFALMPRNMEIIIPLCVPLWLGTDMRKIKNQEMRHRTSKHNFHTRVNLRIIVRNILSNLTKVHVCQS